VFSLVALDFDGVIADSAPEAFAVALRTWFALRPDSSLRTRPDLAAGAAAPERARVLADPVYRRFLQLMPLGNRAEDYAVELAAIEAGLCIPDQAAYDAYKRSLDVGWLRSFHRRFYRVRNAMWEADPERWHRLLGPYPGVPEVLRRRAGAAILAIATAKDRRSVAKLLAAWGLAGVFAEERILDKETGESKRTHIEHLSRSCGVPFAGIVFVDDKVNHLDSVAPLGAACALAAWGYNGEREVALARARGYRVLELEGLEAGLFGAGNS
jgi:phosphoglycolate phosphatase-like HAD superfamily hydrolase